MKQPSMRERKRKRNESDDRPDENNDDFSYRLFFTTYLAERKKWGRQSGYSS